MPAYWQALLCDLVWQLYGLNGWSYSTPKTKQEVHSLENVFSGAQLCLKHFLLLQPFVHCPNGQLLVLCQKQGKNMLTNIQHGSLLTESNSWTREDTMSGGCYRKQPKWALIESSVGPDWMSETRRESFCCLFTRYEQAACFYKKVVYDICIS